MWEELNTDEEVRRTYDLGRYLVVIPALRNFYGTPAYVYYGGKHTTCEKMYNSANSPVVRDRRRAVPLAAQRTSGRRPRQNGAQHSGAGMKILILGGDGYLGWPTAMRLSKAGHQVVVVDNYMRRRLCRKSRLSLI